MTQPFHLVRRHADPRYQFASQASIEFLHDLAPGCALAMKEKAKLVQSLRCKSLMHDIQGCSLLTDEENSLSAAN